MCKIADFANLVLDLVADELDVPKEQILSRSRNAEVVDARYVAVKLLYSHNVYPSRIAVVMGMATRSVQYIITAFDARIQANRMLRNNYAKLAKKLGETYELTA